MSNIDFAYYAEGFQISFLVMNFVAGFYFIFTRFINWSTLSEATTMERQGTFLLAFCVVISVINALEVDSGEKILGWLCVMVLEFLIGAFIGLVIDKYYRL